MTDKIARVCDYCGESDILDSDINSNGMVLVIGEASLLLMRDIKKGEGARPCFALTHKHYHPNCLIFALQKWLKEESNVTVS